MPPHAPLPTEVDALLVRVFNSDRGAARELTERILLPILDAAASRLLLGSRGERFEKTDVIQEVFQHLYRDNWRGLRSYDPGRGSLASYVWATVKNWLRDHARRLPPPHPIDDLESELSPDSGPERKAALGELIDRLQEGLTAEELALFQWVYLEGVSHLLAAERLGVGLDAGHKRVQRLEAKIRAIVSDEARDERPKGRKL